MPTLVDERLRVFRQLKQLDSTINVAINAPPSMQTSCLLQIESR